MPISALRTGKMNIVILDAFTMNPGDLSYEPLSRLGKLTVHERTSPDQTVARAIDAEIILTNKTILSAPIIDQLPKLKYIGVLATGYNVIDIDAANQKNIIVTNIPAYSTASVAQMVFAHLLNITTHLSEHANSVRKGKWSNSIDFCYWDHPQIELANMTMGIIGYGTIGKETAKIARAFSMKLIAAQSSSKATDEDITRLPLKQIFTQSDVLTLHCPLCPQTEKIINARNLSLMKKSAFLINTGRGSLIDEQALANALNTGQIAAAGLDVLSTEPPKPDNPLLTAKNCCITPHIAWATKSARQRLLDTATANVKAFLENAPQNAINP